MIHLNLLDQGALAVHATRIPLAEFGLRGLDKAVGSHLYELALCPAFTLAMDEEQLLSLVEAALDVLPPQHDLANDDDNDDTPETWSVPL